MYFYHSLIAFYSTEVKKLKPIWGLRIENGIEELNDIRTKVQLTLLYSVSKD